MTDNELEKMLIRIKNLEDALMFYATSDIVVIAYDNGKRACDALYGKEGEQNAKD